MFCKISDYFLCDLVALKNYKNVFFLFVLLYKDKKNYDLRDTNIEQIASDIKNQTYKEIIINDSEVQNFESLMNILKESFDYILPKKSSFEI